MGRDMAEVQVRRKPAGPLGFGLVAEFEIMGKPSLQESFPLRPGGVGASPGIDGFDSVVDR